MMRYRVKTVTVPGMRVVHNFYPGPHDDPGRNRRYGWDGFRYWITDEPGNDHRALLLRLARRARALRHRATSKPMPTFGA